MTKDLISIIVPFYNVEKYASKCIKSVINQTYKNIEIILIDDGSPDNCGKICDEYAKKDKRIKVIHKKNGGLSDARNTGLKIAKGKYIGFVDSDDYIANDMYEYLYKLIKDNNADISMCSVHEFFENDTIEIKESNEEEIVYSKEDAIKELLLDKKIRSHSWNKLYKKELFSNIEYPFGKKMEDIAVTYKLFLKSNKIVYGNQIKYFYLQRSNGIMLSKNTNMWIDYYELSIERYNEINKIYPNMLENKYNILNLISYLYVVDNKKFQKYLKNNKVYKVFNKIYNIKIPKLAKSKKDKYRLLLMRLNYKLYKKIYCIYMKGK